MRCQLNLKSVVFSACLPALLVTGPSCTLNRVAETGAEPTPRLAAGEQRAAQLASLRAVYYRDTPAPPSPTQTELDALDRALARAPAAERSALTAYYRDERDLLVFAIRDSDGDGVRDYRVSDYYGKFLEGDVDVDGDGVRNVYDAAPYDAAVGGRDRTGDGAPDEDLVDANRNGLPDHLDWRVLGKPAHQAARQEALFHDHGIILVERSARFTDRLTRSVHDAVTRVFRGPLQRQPRLPTLRTIATEDTCLLTPAVDDDTNAMAVAQTQSLIIYRVGIDYPPLIQLGLVVHELGHNYQFSLDYDAQNSAAENDRVYFPAPGFHALVAPFGWQTQALGFDPKTDTYQVFTPQYYELTPSYTWHGDTPETWADWLEQKYLSAGDGYLDDAEIRAYHIVGDYSLTNPWEWYSDNLIAYTFLEIERRIGEDFAGDVSTAALAAMHRATGEAWPGYAYRNFDRQRLGPHFRRRFPLREADLRYLGSAYVLPLL